MIMRKVLFTLKQVFFLFLTLAHTLSLSREDFDQEEKARFGELCSGESGSKGREWFARYVSAQVCEEPEEHVNTLTVTVAQMPI